MITPRFHLTQSSNTVTIHIRAPYCTLRDLDVSINQHDLIFACAPYYLRLHLPGSLADRDVVHSEFDSDTGMFIFTYKKSNPGEDFPDLDLITKLLCTKVAVNDGSKKIEVLCTEGADESGDTEMSYGFAMCGGHNLVSVLSEFKEVFDIDPHEVKLQDRITSRIETENASFDWDYCFSDLVDDCEISEIIAFESPYHIDEKDLTFTAEELDFLKDLHNVEYKLSQVQQEYCRNSLLDILFAYCYDRRTTGFEGTCESGWTINKLSATLCCFDGFLKPRDSVICAYRRALIYPLHRNLSLCDKVFEDLKSVLKLGVKYIIRCLITMYGIFLKGDGGRYILNNLYIRDYIRYVMKWDNEKWQRTVGKVMTLHIQKSDLGLNLPGIDDSSSIDKKMGRLKLNVLDSDDSTDSDDASSSSYETSSGSDDDEHYSETN